MDKNRNEIDLIELLLKTYLILKKYFIIPSIVIVVGIVYTFIKSYTKTPIYSSYMIIKAQEEDDYLFTITLKEFQNKYEKNPVEIIEKVMKEASDYRSNGNIELLSKRMNLPEEKVKQLISLSTSYKYEKGEAYSNLLTIHAKASNPELFPELSDGIVHFINTNDFFRNQYLSDSILLSNIIKKTEYKIHELDSVHKQLSKKGIYQSTIIMVDEFSTYAESVQLTALRENLMLKMKHLNKVETVEAFYKPVRQEKSLKMDLVVNIIISFFIGCIIILFIVINKKANQIGKKL